jgi:polysaccharide pyruvyl transferase WcaK-like protein
LRKIGILTYFWQDNPGSFLQAYSVLAALKSRFPDDHIEFIDCKYVADRFFLRKRFINPLRFLEGYRRHRAYRCCKAQYLPRSPRGIVTLEYEEAARYIEGLGYDLIVVGSDTVLSMHLPYAVRRQLPIAWLPPRLKCRKVACAASANAMTYETTEEGLREQMAASIKAFDLVGVRDDVTYNLVCALGAAASKVEMMPDPTFSYDVDYAHIERYLRAKNVTLSRPTVCTCLPHGLGAAVAEDYRAKGFRVVALDWGTYADWSPWDISPLAWAGIYRYFDLVVTDRFHVTVFSLKHGVPVVTVEFDAPGHRTPQGLSKRFTLLKQFGLHETNYAGPENIRDAGAIIRMADAALNRFDRQAALSKALEMRERFGRFMDCVKRVSEG